MTRVVGFSCGFRLAGFACGAHRRGMDSLRHATSSNRSVLLRDAAVPFCFVKRSPLPPVSRDARRTVRTTTLTAL
jgi:hypothetical protein